MKIVILSDTHGSAVAWENVMDKFFYNCDLIIHAGDVLYHGPRNPLPEGHDPQRLAQLINNCRIPVIFARGNCDADVDGIMIKYPIQTLYAFLYFTGKTVLVTHGTDMDQNRQVELAKMYRTDIFISGHTHVPVLDKTGDTVFLNPGSCALPKGEEGPTAAIWENGEISINGLIDGKVLYSCRLPVNIE